MKLVWSIILSLFTMSLVAQPFSNIVISTGCPLVATISNGTLFISSAPAHPVDRNILVRFSVMNAPFGPPNTVVADAGADETGRPTYSPNGIISSWTYDWGDGVTTTGTCFSCGDYAQMHRYAAPGTYSITLTAVDSAGFQNSSNKVVSVPVPARLSAQGAAAGIIIEPQPPNRDALELLGSSNMHDWHLAASNGPPWLVPADATLKFFRARTSK